jgi:hypothetical protein
MTQRSTTRQAKSGTTINGWDEAMSRTDSEIEKFEAYLERLKAAKKSFLVAKREGMQWPGSVRAFAETLSGKS